MVNILVVAAHPDDETLGAGGTIAKHVLAGDSVSVVILSKGIESRKTKNEPANAEINLLRENSKRALSKLGVFDLTFFDFPDNAMDGKPILEIVKTIEKVIADKKPSTVYTHHWGDLNIDHQITFSAVLTACRPLGGSPVRKILCFEILSSTEWNVQNSTNAFMPNIFVDISSTLDKKVAALAEYKSEMKPYPYPRSIEGAQLLAKTRGLAICAKAAEAFELVREIIW